MGRRSGEEGTWGGYDEGLTRETGEEKNGLRMCRKFRAERPGKDREGDATRGEGPRSNTPHQSTDTRRQNSGIVFDSVLLSKSLSPSPVARPCQS